ncbi:MAG: hypothetical protein AB7E95_12040 [Kiritimatiellales bacterium]
MTSKTASISWIGTVLVSTVVHAEVKEQKPNLIFPDGVRRITQWIIKWREELPAWSGDAGAGDNGYPWPE